jgi:membrane-bound serine protease (ClpP class)
MKRITPLLLFLAVLLAVLTPARSAQSGAVLRLTIDGTINPITQEEIERAVDRAGAQQASALLIVLRTPGGMLDSTRSIISKILASHTPVIVFVTPAGSRAASAGFMILEAADVAAMSPGTNAGAAHPVIMGEKMDDVMKSKLENDAAAFVRSYVAQRGRNVTAAESAVRESKAWSEKEALDLKLIDFIASDENDLFRQLDGRTITRFDGQKTVLHLQGRTVEDFPASLREQILGWLMDPNIAFLVLAVGGLAIYAEFNHPGAVIPGAVGIVFVLLALFALNLLPTRFAALTLVLGAFLCFALEAKFATHGVLAVAGIALFTIGGLLLVDGPIPEMRVKLLTALGVSLPMGIITVFLMTIALQARRNKRVCGADGLLGELGTVILPLQPVGKVLVHGEYWIARSAQPLGEGAEVRVTAVDGLTLTVEEETAPPQPS